MKKYNLLFVLLIGIIINVAFIIQPVKATEFTVANETELVNAINMANANDLSDIITLTADIILKNQLPDISSIRSLTIQSPEGSNYRIARDVSAGDFSVFTVLPDTYLMLRNITVQDGRSTNGGGIYNVQGIVTLTDSIISENTASSNGGGIYNDGGRLYISDSIISSNEVTTGNGAGIYNTGSLFAERSSIISNHNATNGGGIYNTDVMSFNRVVVSGNDANNGGGIYDISERSPRLFSTLISGNKADNGGGLYLDGTSYLLTTNVTIAGNYATNTGGGIYINSGSYELNNSIIANNLPSEPFIASGGELILNYSLIDALGTASHLNSVINIDPEFTAPVLPINAPTLDGDYTLQVTSPAIDAGSVQLAIIMGLYDYISEDLAGNNRFEQYIDVPDTGEGFPPLDMGAYEVQDDTCDPYETYFGDSQVYEVGTYNSDVAIDLRDAITCANNNNLSDTIALTSDVTLTVVDNMVSGANGLPTILSDYGNTLTIEGNGFAITREATAPNFRILFVDGNADLTLKNITISDGNLPTGDGGGIAVASTASLHLLNSTVSNNRAERGGGIINFNMSSTTITNSVITNNTAILIGGGIYNDASGNIIQNTIISGNTAERGGGIYIGQPSTLINTLVSGNDATLHGGGIENQSISTNIINSTIVSNRAPLAGGIYDAGVDMVVLNSIHWGNTPIAIISDPSISIDHSIIEGGFIGTENLDIDPMFTASEPASNAPTPAGDYTLQENSPAIDSADKTSFLTFGTNITEDLAGNARFNDDGAILNIPSELDRGAYERQGNSCSGYETAYFGLGTAYPIGTVRVDLASDLVVAMRCANSNTSDDTIAFTDDIILTDLEYNPIQRGLPSILRRSISGELTIDGRGFMLTRDVNAPDMMFFHIDHFGVLTINNMTISNAVGGAIKNEGVLFVNDSTFDNNTGYNGGAIYNTSWTTEAHLNNVTMTNNVALISGGAIYNSYGDLYITDSTLEYNRAELTGGAIRNLGNRGTVEIIRSSISYNTAFSYAGGIDGSSETMTIISSILNGNVSQTQAGGAMRTGSDLLIEDTIISGNSALVAGAIFSSYPASITTINNSLITGNVATVRGGAIDNGSILTITNTTIVGNYSPDGGAIFNFSNRSLNIINSIVWGNATNQIAYESVILTVSYSIVEGGQEGTNNTDADPLFVDFQSATLNNPTTAGDFSLLAVSPAIDSADDTVDIGLVDLAGNNRFVDDISIPNTPSILDRGAYEFQGTSHNAPVADNDSYSTDEDTELIGNVTANDTYDDGDNFSVTLLSDVSSGSLTLNSNGSFSYTPNANYNGTDSFTFEVCDTELLCDTATISITVNPVNDNPVLASIGNQSVYEGSTLDVNLSASDVDGNTLSFSVNLDAPSFISLTDNSDGTAILSIAPGFSDAGNYDITVTVSDGELDDSETFTVTVGNVNTAPTADDQSVEVDEDGFVDITLTGSDPEGDSLIFTVLTDPSHGVLSGTAPNLTYTPDADFNGSDSFTFEVCDAEPLCDTATISITVNPIQAPSQPIISAPSGTINDTTPDLIWTDTLDATQYRIWVRTNVSPITVVYDGTVDATSVCSAGTCQVTLPTLADTEYRAFVAGYNSVGWGLWSTGSTFTVTSYVSAPSQPIISAPSGTINDTTPDLIWTDTLDATQYRIWVRTNVSPITVVYDGTVDATSVCSAGTCQVTLPTLADTEYRAFVAGYNSVGWGLWSTGSTFTVTSYVSAPSQPIISAPSGTINDTTPDLIWTDTLDATQYRIWVRTNVSPITVVYDGTVDATSVCSAGTCQVTLPTLAETEYRAFVAGYNSVGWGLWSTGSTFTVTSYVSAPSQPIISAPSGTINDTTPDLIWTDTLDATQYRIWVRTNVSPITVVYDGTVDATSVCSAGTCQVTLPTLAETEYRAFVAGYNSVGWGSWSTGTTFTVSTPLALTNLSEVSTPQIQAGSSYLTRNEGSSIFNTIQVFNMGEDVIVTSNVGTITSQPGGWLWQGEASDNTALTTVTITATDDLGTTITDTFDYEVLNINPTAIFRNVFDDPVFQGTNTVFVFSDPTDVSSVDTTAGFNYAVICDAQTSDSQIGVETNYTCTYDVAGIYTVMGMIRDKDGGISNYSLIVEVITPVQATQYIKSVIQDLNTNDGLSLDASNQLSQMMDNVQASLVGGNTQNSLNQVSAFIEQVNSYVALGTLSQAQGDLLIGHGQRLISSIIAS